MFLPVDKSQNSTFLLKMSKMNKLVFLFLLLLSSNFSIAFSSPLPFESSNISNRSTYVASILQEKQIKNCNEISYRDLARIKELYLHSWD